MSRRLDLTLFAHVCSRPEEEIDLGESALLIGALAEPNIDVSRWIAMLDDLGRGARQAITPIEADGPTEPRALERARIEGVLRFLYEQKRFRGNREDYYDPRNSFLHEVLARRVGIPISLAVVLMEVGRRAGFDMRGVSFPNHFLVRVETSRNTSLLIDPFSGKLLDRDELRALYSRVTGERGDPPARLLEPTQRRQILLRMLNNLRGIYAARGERERLSAVLERIYVLSPSAELREAIERFGGTPPFTATTKHDLN